MSGNTRVLQPFYALIACVSLAACGGNDTTSGTTATPDATQPPATQAPAFDTYAGHEHRHRHHRHHRSGGTSDVEGSANGANAGAGAPVAAASANGAYPCNDASFVAVQGEFASGALEGDQLVNVCGSVTRVLAARTTRSGLHGYFYVRVATNDEIEIVSDLGQMNAPAWPWVRAGDTATVRGRYYYDSASSQGIDWTHHGASGSWPSPGYVVINGTAYR